MYMGPEIVYFNQKWKLRETSHAFQVLCERGTSCGDGNECGATFSLSRRDTDGLPRVSEVYKDCGSAASSEAATTASANHRGQAPTTTIADHEVFAFGSNHHEERDLPVNDILCSKGGCVDSFL